MAAEVTSAGRHEAPRARVPDRADSADQWQGIGFVSQVWVLTGRSLHSAFSDVKTVFFTLLQPVVLLLLFSQVFRSVGKLPGVTQYDGYINFLLPATLVSIAMTSAMTSGFGLLSELYTGFIGRLRAMPLNMFAVLLARTLSDAARLAVQIVVVVLAAALFLDFRPGSVPGLLGAMVLVVVLGWSVGWVSVAVVAWQRKPEIVQAISFTLMFPLMFGSSAYMPVQAMPPWLRVFSKINPLTYAIDAARSLAVGTPVGSTLGTALALLAAIASAGAAVAARSFGRGRA